MHPPSDPLDTPRLDSRDPKPGGNRAQRRASSAAFRRTPQGRVDRAKSGPVWRRGPRLIAAYTAALDAWDATFDAAVADTIGDTDGSALLRARNIPAPPTPEEHGLTHPPSLIRARYSMCYYLYLGVSFSGTPR